MLRLAGTPPHDWGTEIRCFLRDPDGHLVEISQAKARPGVQLARPGRAVRAQAHHEPLPHHRAHAKASGNGQMPDFA
jgi:hypothetical protein